MSFLNQSQNIVEQIKPMKSRITFDTELKIALWDNIPLAKTHKALIQPLMSFC